LTQLRQHIRIGWIRDQVDQRVGVVYSFVRKEALLTSEIEGTQATLVDVMSYEQTGQSGSSDVADVEEVTNYVLAKSPLILHH
jgi:Fic family protein